MENKEENIEKENKEHASKEHDSEHHEQHDHLEHHEHNHEHDVKHTNEGHRENGGHHEGHESTKDLIVKLAKYKEEIEKLKEEVKAITEEKDKTFNSMLLIKADSENYKKRADKDTELAVSYANKAIIKDLLPSLDSIDVALGSIADEKTKEGLQMVKTSIFQALSKHGLEKIEAKEGQDFDPEIHEACLIEETDTIEGEKIALELQSGYTLNKKMLRPCKVKVLKGKEKNTPSDEKSESTEAKEVKIEED